MTTRPPKRAIAMRSRIGPGRWSFLDQLGEIRSEPRRQRVAPPFVLDVPFLGEGGNYAPSRLSVFRCAGASRISPADEYWGEGAM